MSRIPYGLKMIGLVLGAFVISIVWIFSATSSATVAYTPQPSPAVPAATAPIVAAVPPPTERPTADVAASTPPPPPGPVLTVTPVPTLAPAPATYEWVNMERVPSGSRLRLRVAIVMPPEYSDDQIVRAFQDAMKRAFREQPTAKAAVVFGHSSRAEVSKGADLGSAWASSDRQGWAGDGKFDADRDEGKLYVNIGSAWTVRPQSHLVTDR